MLNADRAWNDGHAKKRLIAAFSLLDDPELVGTYRRKMSSLLFQEPRGLRRSGCK